MASTTIELGLSIKQEPGTYGDRDTYEWCYSQEGAVGHGLRGRARSVAGCIAEGMPICEREAKLQGADRIDLTLSMADGRLGSVVTVAANRQATLGELADALVASLRSYVS